MAVAVVEREVAAVLEVGSLSKLAFFSGGVRGESVFLPFIDCTSYVLIVLRILIPLRHACWEVASILRSCLRVHP